MRNCAGPLASHSKFVGVRHVLQDETDDDFCLGLAFQAGISQLRQFDLTYDLLVFPRQLPAATALVSGVPETALRAGPSQSLRSRNRRLIPGAHTSRNWRLCLTFRAKFQAWSRKPIGNPGSPPISFRISTWCSTRSDRTVLCLDRTGPWHYWLERIDGCLISRGITSPRLEHKLRQSFSAATPSGFTN